MDPQRKASYLDYISARSKFSFIPRPDEEVKPGLGL